MTTLWNRFQQKPSMCLLGISFLFTDYPYPSPSSSSTTLYPSHTCHRARLPSFLSSMFSVLQILSRSELCTVSSSTSSASAWSWTTSSAVTDQSLSIKCVISCSKASSNISVTIEPWHTPKILSISEPRENSTWTELSRGTWVGRTFNQGHAGSNGIWSP